MRQFTKVVGLWWAATIHGIGGVWFGAATMHLTNKEPIRNGALAASGPPEATGAPAEKIEITPEMIEAGREEIAVRWLDFISTNLGPSLWDEVLSRVFLAMSEARIK